MPTVKFKRYLNKHDLQLLKIQSRRKFIPYACSQYFKAEVHSRMEIKAAITRGSALVGEPRDQNKANFNKLRQIAKFGMIVYYKIVINNLI